jgi:hypothetical protein
VKFYSNSQTYWLSFYAVVGLTTVLGSFPLAQHNAALMEELVIKRIQIKY